MPSVSLRGTIRRPVEEVFDFVADSCNDVHWVPLVKGIERTRGDAPGKGTVYIIQQELLGRGVVPMELVTAGFDRPRHLAWTMEMGALGRYRSTMDLAPDGDGTRLMQRNTVTTGRRIDGAAWWFGAQFILRDQMRRLRRHLEAGATTP